MRYTHIMFDIDNTLANTIGVVLRGLQKTLRDITGEYWDISRLLPVLGIPGLDTFECLDIYPPDQIFRTYPRQEQYEQGYQYTAHLHEGIVPLLDLLKEEGCSLGITTSKTMPRYTCSLPLLQISGYFQIAITADDIVHRKPDPEPMPEHMKRTDAYSQQILYIGDSICDMQYVSRAGVDSCLVSQGCHCPDDISFTHCFEDPAAIIR